MEIFSQYDLIVDGTDNFATRYLVNDACVLLNKPYVWGSIYRFDGQASRLLVRARPLLPLPLPGARRRPAWCPSCAEGGVLGVLCASIGSIQVDRGHQAAHRHRRAAGRPADDLRRPGDELPQGQGPQGPGLRGLRREPDRHRAHRLRGLLRRRLRGGPGGGRRLDDHRRASSRRGWTPARTSTSSTSASRTSTRSSRSPARR